jgi:hypothetical protein
MQAILEQRRIALWELICQQYKIPKHRFEKLDAIIRKGEELPARTR